MLTTCQLPATKSKAERVVAVTRNFDAVNPADLTLTVTECKPRGRTISARYGVQEVPAGRFLNGRRFLLHKEAHAGDDDTVRGKTSVARVTNVYKCCIPVRGVCTCTCPAGAARMACDHALALAALIESGGLEHPLEGPSR